MSNANRHLILEKTYPPCTIYKGENPEEPGCSIELHDLPELLRFTFLSASYPAEEVFSAGDMNLYDHARHHSWYQPPDWFKVVGMSRLNHDRDLRSLLCNLARNTQSDGGGKIIITG